MVRQTLSYSSGGEMLNFDRSLPNKEDSCPVVEQGHSDMLKTCKAGKLQFLCQCLRIGRRMMGRGWWLQLCLANSVKDGNGQYRANSLLIPACNSVQRSSIPATPQVSKLPCCSVTVKCSCACWHGSGDGRVAEGSLSPTLLQNCLIVCALQTCAVKNS